MGQLHERMEQDLKLKNVSPATRKIYLLYARKFVAHYGRPPTELGEREIRLYLLHLIEVEAVSHGTYRQCLAAIKFLYTVTLGQEWQVKRLPFPRHSRRLPVTLRLDQVAAVREMAETAASVNRTVCVNRMVRCKQENPRARGHPERLAGAGPAQNRALSPPGAVRPHP